jgi:hypothetical protein
MRICIGCGVLEKDEDVVGRTRDPRRGCRAVGWRDSLSLWHASFRVGYRDVLYCVSKLHHGCIGG